MYHPINYFDQNNLIHFQVSDHIKRLEQYNVMGMLSIFSYNFEFANKKFENENISINCLSDYNTLVELIQSEGKLDFQEINRLKKWREDPKTWS